MGFLPQPTESELEGAEAQLAVAFREEHGDLTPLDRTLLGSAVVFEAYRGWFTLREEIEPYLGERAVALFAHEIARAYGADAVAGRFREWLIAEGDDPDHPQVTEAESLLLEWGAQLGRGAATVDSALVQRVEATFQPRLRLLLTAFAGLTAARCLVSTAGGRR